MHTSAELRDEMRTAMAKQRVRIEELEAALRVVDSDIRHHLRSDIIDAALIRPHAVQAVRAALAKK